MVYSWNEAYLRLHKRPWILRRTNRHYFCAGTVSVLVVQFHGFSQLNKFKQGLHFASQTSDPGSIEVNRWCQWWWKPIQYFQKKSYNQLQEMLVHNILLPHAPKHNQDALVAWQYAKAHQPAPQCNWIPNPQGTFFHEDRNPPALPACLVVWGLMTDCLSVLCFCLYSLS